MGLGLTVGDVNIKQGVRRVCLCEFGGQKFSSALFVEFYIYLIKLVASARFGLQRYTGREAAEVLVNSGLRRFASDFRDT